MNKRKQYEWPEIEHYEDEIKDLTEVISSQDPTEWMEQDSFDFYEKGLTYEDVSELIGMQVLSVEELEEWKRGDSND